MIKHIRRDSQGDSFRKDAVQQRKALSKNSIHLICVIVMQLLQLTQGLVTESDYNAFKIHDNTSIVVIAPSSQTYFPEGESSILKELVSPSAVMVTADGFKIADSLLIPQASCAPFISCDIIGPGSSNCCPPPVARTDDSLAQLADPELSQHQDITPTAVKNLNSIEVKSFKLKDEENLSLGQNKQRRPNINSINAFEEKCKGMEIFLPPKSFYPQNISLRMKREAQRNPINARNRFRRPTTQKTTTEQEEEPEEVTQSTINRRKSGNLHTSSNKPTVASSRKGLIKPSRVSSSPGSRAKFTLREESTTQRTSSTSPKRAPFRRPQISSGIGSKRVTNSKINSSIGNNRRINNHEESHTRSSLPGRGRSPSTTGRSRSSLRDSDSRARHRGSQDNEPVLDLNDGTITITHLTPSETQIPSVNGQITEYKQIVVAKTSTEVLGPHQYSKSFSPNGQSILVLTSQATSVNHAGATEVTQFVLHESPTTSVTFTPTTIRGRRTSFSYVLPSTAYSVENVVSTIQPQISADAPLANILLSQLLLGNVGFPSNPLFGGAQDNNVNLNANGGNNVAPTPITEYKTHASTYVTTVFEGTSTVLPITFQGKRITTTIYDTTPQVITATEFVTDTIVLPGAPAMQLQQQPQQNQINNLLLQQLLLQQVAQKPDPIAQLPQITPTTQQAFGLDSTQLPDFENENHLRDTGHNGLLPSSSHSYDQTSEATTERGGKRRNGKKHKKRNKEEAKLGGEASVVTLYVSGKFPGEFSTVLSTVYVKPDATVHKRHATDYYSEGHMDVDDEGGLHDDSDDDVMDLPRSLASESVSESKAEATQSLMEILGENHKWQVDNKPSRS